MAATWLPRTISAAPTPYVPVPVAPALPVSPLGRSLSGAYQALVRAATADPAAAQRAGYLYVLAQQRASRGDMAGALAAAAAAQGEASTPPFPQAQLAPATSTIQGLPAGRLGEPSNYAPTGTLPPASSVPLADTGAVLPADLLVARNEIELAARLGPSALLEAAKKHYRTALDAYLSGNAARSRAEARASFEASSEVFSKAK